MRTGDVITGMRQRRSALGNPPLSAAEPAYPAAGRFRRGRDSSYSHVSDLRHGNSSEVAEVEQHLQRRTGTTCHLDSIDSALFLAGMLLSGNSILVVGRMRLQCRNLA
jgi:hypothetical protein